MSKQSILTIKRRLDGARKKGEKGVFRCPNCGAEVMVYSDRWECGDCGGLGSLPGYWAWQSRRVPGALVEELEEGVYSILEGMRAFCSDEEETNMLVWKLTAYGITVALRPKGNRTARRVALLQAFYREYPVCRADDVLALVRENKLAFPGRFELSETERGSFWVQMAEKLPNGPEKPWPEWADQIVDGLSQVEACFSGDAPDKLSAQIRRLLQS